MCFNRTDTKETLIPIEHAVVHNQEFVITRPHLLAAAGKYQVDVVRRLLRSGVDRNPGDDDDIRPLGLVVQRRNMLSRLARDRNWLARD
ncbi:hypothetical protein DL769_006191 [Monosporascus sp. CRB-8-3]|nr:hypothetical protein DL769_006191 [Monosporascus sp. CRB-8-3]